jgi:hypothetical protein
MSKKVVDSKKEKEMCLSYLFFCPIKFGFVDVKDDCPKCKDFSGGNCPFYMEIELVAKPEVEKAFTQKVKWI